MGQARSGERAAAIYLLVITAKLNSGEKAMKRMMVAAVAAVSLVLVGHGTLRAAGQPQCETGEQAGAAPGQQANPQDTGAAPGQQYGTEANVEAKKQVDAQKYQSAGASSATEACPETPPPVGGTSSDRKQ